MSPYRFPQLKFPSLNSRPSEPMWRRVVLLAAIAACPALSIAALAALSWFVHPGWGVLVGTYAFFVYWIGVMVSFDYMMQPEWLQGRSWRQRALVCAGAPVTMPLALLFYVYSKFMHSCRTVISWIIDGENDDDC